MLATFVERLRARNLTLSRLQAMHPAIDRTVKATRRALYLRDWFRAGPRRRGAPHGKTFVVFNHCYELDIEALCAADTQHTLWVLDAFSVFTDVAHYFPDGQRDIDQVYGAGEMAASIARFKRAYVSRLADKLVRETKLDALITPSDVFFYLRPLMEELRDRGVPTIVQDKEGTIAPGTFMDDHADMLRERYPPIGDQYYLWNEAHFRFLHRAGLDPAITHILGQPRSDFFFQPDRWPSKQSLGLTENKKLVVMFTFDADVYVRNLERNPDMPWRPLRDHMHAAGRELARMRSDVEVVIKAHPQAADLADIRTEVAADPLPNVSLVTANVASPLIVHADVILGFQSTVMIEAMMTKAPVIYVGWGPKHDHFDRDMIPIHRSGGVLIPDSRDALDRMLRDALDGKLSPSEEMRAARKQFTDRYFWNADGLASKRILDHAAQFVQSRARRHAR
jgi:hypothetical protein